MLDEFLLFFEQFHLSKELISIQDTLKHNHATF